MNKTLLHLLTALLLAIATLPGVSHATPDGDDYVAVQVPNVTQAVTFFRDVMNCRAIRGDSSTSAADQVALMTCGRETTVEIRRAAPTPASPKTSKLLSVARQPLTLDTDDATGVTVWLRTNHIPLIALPTRVSSGPDAGKVAVSFLTPWGEPLRLISRIRSDDLLPSTMPSSRVAAE